MLRVFQLIRHLSRQPYKTLPQIAKILGISPRSVQRYIQLLTELGYVIECEIGTGRYFLCEYDSEKSDFSVEEAAWIRHLLTAAAAEHPFTGSVLQKLSRHSEIVPIAHSLLKAHNGRMIEKLMAAMREQKQVVLKNYHSASSDTVADRHVEPLLLDENYVLLSTFELASGQMRDFKVERIGDVQVLDAPITCKTAVKPPDLFGMSGESAFTVTLRLTSRAYRLLIEEFPETRPFIKNDGKCCVFSTQVQGVEGVGRFVLGLCDEVEVAEPEELKQYLREKVERAGWRNPAKVSFRRP